MLWLKAFHVIFMVTWFAGLFYLPRLFVYHCDVRDIEGYARFCGMERKLFVIMSIGAAGTIAFGLSMLAVEPALLKMGWLQAKLALALGLVGYHTWLRTRVRAFASRTNTTSARSYRLVNEIPALFLIAMVTLAVI